MQTVTLALHTSRECVPEVKFSELCNMHSAVWQHLPLLDRKGALSESISGWMHNWRGGKAEDLQSQEAKEVPSGIVPTKRDSKAELCELPDPTVL